MSVDMHDFSTVGIYEACSVALIGRWMAFPQIRPGLQEDSTVSLRGIVRSRTYVEEKAIQ